MVLGGKNAVVASVTLTVDAAEPLSTIELGDTAHVDSAGAPVQAKVTDWLNPPLGATVSE